MSPKVEAFVTCQRIEGEETGQPSLIGVMDRISPEGFPFMMAEMGVYVAFSNVRTPVVIRLGIVRMEPDGGEIRIAEALVQALPMSAPFRVRHLCVMLENLTFHKEGVHFVRVSHEIIENSQLKESIPLGERRLTVAMEDHPQ